MEDRENKKMKSKVILATLAVVLALVMTINVAYGVDYRVASVVMVDGSGNKVHQYNIGETIRALIETTNVPIMNLEIRIFGPGGAVVENAILPGPYLQGITYEFAALPPGYYMLYADNIPVGAFVASASFFVLPESMLGTLTATVAGFAAFATIGIVKHKHKKSK